MSSRYMFLGFLKKLHTLFYIIDYTLSLSRKFVCKCVGLKNGATAFGQQPYILSSTWGRVFVHARFPH